MNLSDFFEGLDSLFARKELASVDEYLSSHLVLAQGCGNVAYQLAVLNEQVGYYRSLGRFAQSLTAAEQAMVIISAPDFTDGTTAATTMLNVATALRASGNIDDAMDMYEKVCEVYVKHLEENDPRLAALYNNMSQALMAGGNREAALNYLHKSLAILASSPEHRPELATTHSNIAVLYIALNNNQAAETHLQAAMSIFESLDYDDAHYPAALAAMAQLLHIKADYHGAVEYYRLALDKTAAIFGKNIDYARICRNCARAYSLLEMSTEADELLQQASEIDNKLRAASAPRHTEGQA